VLLRTLCCWTPPLRSVSWRSTSLCDLRVAARVSRTLTGRSVAGHSSRAHCTHTHTQTHTHARAHSTAHTHTHAQHIHTHTQRHTHTHTQSPWCGASADTPTSSQATNKTAHFVLHDAEQRRYFTFKMLCDFTVHGLTVRTYFHGARTYRPYVPNSRYMDLPSVHTKLHGTRTYRPYVPNFTVQGLTVRTYQISRYKDLPSERTKFHGTWTYRPYVPNFTVQGLTVRTYQISRYKDLPSARTKFHGPWTYRPYVPILWTRHLVRTLMKI